MTNTFIIVDSATGRAAETQVLADNFAPVLGANQRAVYGGEGQVAAGTFSASGTGPAGARLGPFTVAVWGLFTGTLGLESSFDGGTTWLPVVDDEGLAAQVRAPGQISYRQTEPGVLYRVAFTHASGAASWQIGQ